LTLLSSVISTNFENDGQDVPTAGQVASLTSSNNFINFCALFPNLPLTNGQQVTTGSCNNAPIGIIPSTSNIPSGKFSSPPNFGTIKADTSFDITMNVQNIEMGFFTNAKETYYAAPQTLNTAGQIKGHSHFVIEAIQSLADTTPTDPLTFVFFQGVNTAAVNGAISITVTAGVPSGVYRCCSINAAANHQPVVAPIAQHGLMDDCIYFTANADGQPTTGSNSTASTSTDSATATGSANVTTTATTADASTTDVANSTGIAFSTVGASSTTSATGITFTTIGGENSGSSDTASAATSSATGIVFSTVDGSNTDSASGITFTTIGGNKKSGSTDTASAATSSATGIVFSTVGGSTDSASGIVFSTVDNAAAATNTASASGITFTTIGGNNKGGSRRN
jgi:hypothetical protein